MGNYRDNGSFSTGFWMCIVAIGCMYAGYWLRDNGFVIQIQQPTQAERMQAEPIGRR